jgi:hypothetical protein
MSTIVIIAINMPAVVVSTVCDFTEDQIPVMMMSIKDSVKAEFASYCLFSFSNSDDAAVADHDDNHDMVY